MAEKRENRGLILVALTVTVLGATIVGLRVGKTQYAKELKPLSNSERDMSINRESMENRIYNVPLTGGVVLTATGTALSLKGINLF